MTAPDLTELVDRTRHRTAIDTVLTLAALGLVEWPTEALYAVGVRAPVRYLEDLRARYPQVYGALDDTATAEEPLGRAALEGYLADLEDLTAAIGRLREDPVGELDTLGILEGLNPQAHAANVAEDVAEERADQYDRLVGESYQPTRDGRVR